MFSYPKSSTTLVKHPPCACAPGSLGNVAINQVGFDERLGQNLDEHNSQCAHPCRGFRDGLGQGCQASALEGALGSGRFHLCIKIGTQTVIPIRDIYAHITPDSKLRSGLRRNKGLSLSHTHTCTRTLTYKHTFEVSSTESQQMA